MNPYVSVVMPVYNCAYYVSGAVKSILNQSFKDIELIVIDDGSTDTTASEVVKAARGDSRLALISRENKGIVASLNEGIKLARGELIARMDGDDISLPERLITQVRRFDSDPELGVLGGWLELFGCRREVWHYRAEHNFIRAMLLFRTNGFGHNSVMMRRSLFTHYQYAAGFDDVEDTELWCRMAVTGDVKFSNVREILVRYRIHQTQVSALRRIRQLDLYRLIMKRYLEGIGVPTLAIDMQAHEWSCEPYALRSLSELQQLTAWLWKLNKVTASWDEYGVVSERLAIAAAASGYGNLGLGSSIFPACWLAAKRLASVHE